MSLPLPSPTFYRMADRSPASGDIQGLLDAIYAALTSTVDYRGTSLASTHLWTVGRQQLIGVTQAVYATPPAGTPMTLAPTLIIAGAAAGTPTMASPDSFAASNVLIGIVKNSGAWNAWDAASPATSGTFSGYWRGCGTTWNNIAAKVRVFIGQEIIFIQLIGATVTSQAWLALGAIVEPHATNAASGGLDAEADDRLYGMWCTGAGAVVDAAWMDSATATNSPLPWSHSTTAGTNHCMVWQPGTSTLYTCGRKHITQAVAAIAACTTPSGVYVGDIVTICRTSATTVHNGSRLGTARGMYPIGNIQSGRTLRNGSTDLYHVVSNDTSAVQDALLLPAVA